MKKNRYVELMGGQDRIRAFNNRTVTEASLSEIRQNSVRSLFLRNYGQFAEKLKTAEAGVAVVAMDERNGRLAGLAWVAAKADAANAVVVGRHSHTDLFLDGYEGLALRQLAVVVEPVKSWQANKVEVSYRVLDLRSENGFRDEHDNDLRGLRCEGPAFIRCRPYVLFLLVTGDPLDWPDDPEEAWSFIPERVYFDELTRFAQGSQSSALPLRVEPRRERSLTLITRTVGPVSASEQMLVGPEESAVALLEVIGTRGRNAIRLGREVLGEGVLVGRYDRCQGTGLAVDDTVSRVHLLVMLQGTRAYAIDTGSSNGTHLNQEQIDHLVELKDGMELVVGIGGTRIRWRWL